MPSQEVINLIISGVGAIIGWILKTIWDALKDLKDDIRVIETEMHVQYIRRDEVQKNFDDVRNDLREIYGILRDQLSK